MALHTINKVVLDFSFDEKEREAALSKTKGFFYDDMLPQINRSFDDRTENIYIEKLEIDIGQTTLADLRSDFLRKFERQWNEIYPDQIIRPAGNKLSPSITVHRFSAEQFIFFLQRGYWQWNFQGKPEKELTDLVFNLFRDKIQVKGLLEKIRIEPGIVTTRLLQFLFGKTKLVNIFFSVLQEYHPALNQSGIVLTEWLGSKKIQPGIFFAQFIRELLITLPLHSIYNLKKLLLEIIGKYLAKRTTISKEEARSIKRMRALLEAEQEEFDGHRILSMMEALFDNKTGKRLFNEESIIVAANVSRAGANDKSSPIPYFTGEEKEKINIGNAGLIFFHPYLRFVFKEFAWINEENKFTSIRSQQKAILFLQYLVNGKSRQQEHELVLNKILCNWELSRPLETSCNFSSKEKEAADELNKSLREHWTVLKNTSARGLIKSFIERKAVVEKSEKDFSLRVEKNSIDILLGTLPFGIQTIKLPWNEYFIHTEWTY